MARRPKQPTITTHSPAGTVQFGNLPWWAKHYGGLPGASFQPYKPPPVPTGTYDPALDAQLGAAQRGYGDTNYDINLALTRGAEDYGIKQHQYDEAVGNENDAYNRNVGLLAKNYQNLAAQQGDEANAAGVVPGGGAYLQSQAKRTANQATDQAGLDLQHGQALQALKDQWDQFSNVDYLRNVTDLGNQLTRAGRENTQFGLDIGAEKGFQAGQAGYIAPKPGQPGGRPLNERVLGSGQHVRNVVVNGIRYTYDRHGKIVSTKRVH